MARRTGKAPQASSSSSHTRRRTDHHKAGEANGGVASGKAPSSSSRPRGIHDVYDFAVEQHDGQGKSAGRHLRRVKAGASVDDADALTGHRKGRRNFDDEDVSEDEQPRRDQTYLEDSDDEEANAIAEEDDSDIDSDEAFAASDEERYEDVDFGKSRGKGLRLNGHRQSKDDESTESKSDDQEEDEEEDEGMVDLSKMLDADESEDADTASDEEGDDGSDLGDNRLNDLASRYAQPSNKRSVQDREDSAAGAKRQRRVLAERTEAVPESDFAAPSGSGSSKQALALEDFLAPLSNAAPGTQTALRNDTKALQDLASSGNHNLKASRRGGGALSAPLPAVVKDRLQRAAGYDLSKEEAEKWQSTIKRLREAEHIAFPLQGGPSRPKATTAQMSATFKPTNAFETEIEKILQGEGLSEAQINKSEELAMRQMDPAEVERRRDELRKMRDLMFRAEQKAKRVSKIKSKTYRKIARKDKEKERERLREAGVLDDDDDYDQDGEDLQGQIKAERDRAQERATLKHKNTGKWAKTTLGRKDLGEDVDARQALNEQLQRSEQLRRKIKGLGDSSEDESDSSDEEGRAHDDPRQGALDELKALGSTAHQIGSDNSGTKGVWNMKFMQDARNRDEAVADQARDELEKELRAMKEDRDKTDESSSSGDETPVVGRRKFGGQAFQPDRTRAGGDGVTKPLASGDVDEDEHSSDEAVEAHPSPAQKTAARSKPSRQSLATSDAYESPASNPWLSGKVRSQRTGETLVDKASSAASKSARKLEKRKSKASQAKSEEQQDAQLDIDPKTMLGSGGTKNMDRLQLQPSAPLVPPSRQVSAAFEDGADADSQDEAEDEEELLEVGGGAGRNRNQALSQRDLIAEAFAGDDVAAEFANEKARQIEADAPREVDTTLPGWGAWGGKGIKKSHKSGAAQAARKKANMKLIPGLDASQRRDANMANVIINERRDKKAEKYKAKELPYPYTSAEQYEASLAQPLGQEWNTLTQTQRLTMPRVLKPKPGAVIKPIQRVG